MPARILSSTDYPQPGTLEAIFNGLSRASEPLIGAARPHLLVIPIANDSDVPRGGLWGWTMFEWLNTSLLFVPAPLRRRDIHLAAFSFQGVAFYEKRGYCCFGLLDDLPSGHAQIYFKKSRPSPTRPVLS